MHLFDDQRVAVLVCIVDECEYEDIVRELEVFEVVVCKCVLCGLDVLWRVVGE